MTARSLPRPARWMLEEFLAGPNRDAIVGDIQEMWSEGRRSFAWLYREVTAAVVVNVIAQVRLFKIETICSLAVGWLLLTECAGLGGPRRQQAGTVVRISLELA